MNYNLTNYKNNNTIINKIRKELQLAQEALIVADPATEIIKKLLVVKEEEYYVKKGKDNKTFRIYLDKTVSAPKYSIVDGELVASDKNIDYQVLSDGTLKPIEENSEDFKSFAVYIINISGDNLEIKYKKYFDNIQDAINKMFIL